MADLAAKIQRQIAKVPGIIGTLAEDMTIQIVTSTYNPATGTKAEAVSATTVKGVLQHVTADDTLVIEAGITGLRALLFISDTTPEIPVSSRLVVQGTTYRVNQVKKVSAADKKLIAIVGLEE